VKRAPFLTKVPLIVQIGVLALGMALLAAVHHGTDFAVFYRAGGDVLHGVSPYWGTSMSQLYGGHAFVYPPPAAYAFAPLALLPYGVAKFSFMLLSCLATIIATRLLGATTMVPAFVLVASAVGVRSLDLGTANGVLLFLVAACWYWRDRPARVGVALACAVLLKLFLLPLVVWLAVTGRVRALVWTIGTCGVALAVTAPLLHFSAAAYVHGLGVLSAHEEAHSRSVTGVVRMLGVSSPHAHLVAAVLGGALIVVGVIGARRHRDERIVLLACWSGALVMSPIVWAHYGLLLLGAWVFAGASRSQLVALSFATWLLTGPSPLPGLFFAALAFGAVAYRWQVAARARSVERVDAAPEFLPDLLPSAPLAETPRVPATV
jgi:alpha-1,2-mannosyltransferase